MKDFKELFVTKRDSIYSDTNKINEINLAFKCSCIAMKSVVTLPEHNEVVYKGILKNVIGYRGVGIQSGIFSGVWSPKALDARGNGKIKKVYDHVIGATLAGKLVLDECIESDWNIDSLIKQGWIHENLYLWGTIKVTGDEHKKTNILRDKNSLAEKNILEHYKTINIDDLILY